MIRFYNELDPVLKNGISIYPFSEWNKHRGFKVRFGNTMYLVRYMVLPKKWVLKKYSYRKSGEGFELQ